jgi:uncharacterized protein
MFRWVGAFTLALALLPISARAELRVPELTGPVVDQAGMLRSSTRDALENLLRQVRERGGSQIQVAILPDLGGLAIEDASIKITDAWKLGGAKEDNGVLLLIAAGEHKVRIEVGQGLEGVLPDAIASRIVRDVIVPYMRQGKPDQAVLQGVLAILHNTDPKLAGLSGQPQVAPRAPWNGDVVQLILILLFFGFFLLPLFFRGGRGGGFWGGFGGGGWGSGGGFGGGGFGGGFGGGWSGGGGGFSGGGASGGW